MHYAETFLSPSELREDQSGLDPHQSEGAKLWCEHIKKMHKGQLPFQEWDSSDLEHYFCIEKGELKSIESSEKDEKFEQYENYYRENPEIYQEQIEYNRKKADNRIKRKGYK